MQLSQQAQSIVSDILEHTVLPVPGPHGLDGTQIIAGQGWGSYKQLKAQESPVASEIEGAVFEAFVAKGNPREQIQGVLNLINAK